MFVSTTTKYRAIMTTVANIIQDNNLTALETSVVNELSLQLAPWIGCETYSPVEHSDVADALGIKVASVKGAVGSLVKKGVLDVHIHEEQRDCYGKIDEPETRVIYFVEQETMSL